jgi:PhoH-like ATPase
MTKKTYVIDTSVFLTDSECIYAFENNDIVIPIKVLEEIDKHKGRQDSPGLNARRTIRTLDAFRKKGSLNVGVRIGKGKGKIRVANLGTEPNLPAEMSMEVPDHQIIATATNEQELLKPRKVIMVSRDINMRVLCDSLELLSEDYKSGKVVKERTDLYDGFSRLLVDDEIIDRFYSEEKIILEEKESKLFYPNQFLMLVSNSSEKKTCLAKYANHGEPLGQIGKFKSGNSIWGVDPRNKEQTFALDLLMDPDIPIVTLVGKAGCGKTLLAIASGLQQVIGKSGKVDGDYTRLIVTRPVQPLGRDLGYLPGTLEEKMNPWLAPIQDNLQFLMGNDKVTLEEYSMQGIIEIEALTYIRGRSLSKAFLIVDEAQNLTSHELKTIVTRVGEGTKVVLTGDIEQIDNVYIDETSNGLAYAIEKFKHYSLSGHITLNKGERSEVATLASKVL